ncbi:hypothetical protein SAMN04515667_2836 [Formosa sp. Hel1_31_208]|uniref:hypothetical protein n=1 Tax=Formosa sp. Hel1_31_208 TaxID=1798225 RepID=UPI00087B7E5D|nr:hypothetical protein [Formosa sp. Hel1_31_208]SDS72511.1 hypothetical protein SAMN04515667_2836 [Formosa sp. Hel1_31_208]
MKNLITLAVAFICFSTLNAQTNDLNFKATSGLNMETEYASDNIEIRDILSFEGIDYMKIKFSGKELKGKSYHLTVKEIWNGEVVSDTTVLNSKTLGLPQFETLKDSMLKMRVISKRTRDNKLKLTFKFSRFSVTKTYDAIASDDYALRNLADESNLDIGYNEKFNFLAYILPYERPDGSNSWCEIGTSGDAVETWGEKFGIEHYLLFEMKFE